MYHLAYQIFIVNNLMLYSKSERNIIGVLKTIALFTFKLLFIIRLDS